MFKGNYRSQVYIINSKWLPIKILKPTKTYFLKVYQHKITEI